MEFYDGQIRPKRDIYLDWIESDLKRVCLNCGEPFGEHVEYTCPTNRAHY